MPIPWLIGGAVVAAAAAVTAVVASDSGSKSSTSGSESAKTKARELEAERAEKLKRASETEWLEYSGRLLKNLASKYKFPDEKSLSPYVMPKGLPKNISAVINGYMTGSKPVTTKTGKDPELLKASALHQKHTNKIAQLDEALSELEDAWLALEDLDAQFR